MIPAYRKIVHVESGFAVDDVKKSFTPCLDFAPDEVVVRLITVQGTAGDSGLLVPVSVSNFYGDGPLIHGVVNHTIATELRYPIGRAIPGSSVMYFNYDETAGNATNAVVTLEFIKWSR